MTIDPNSPELRPQILGGLAVMLLNERVQEATAEWQEKMATAFTLDTQELYNPNQAGSMGFKFNLGFNAPTTNLFDLSQHPIKVGPGPHTVYVRFEGVAYPDEESCDVVEGVLVSPDEAEEIEAFLLLLWDDLGIGEQAAALTGDTQTGPSEQSSSILEGWQPMPTEYPDAADYDGVADFLNGFGLKEGDKVVWVTNAIGGNSSHDEVISYDYFTSRDMFRREGPEYTIHGVFHIAKLTQASYKARAYLRRD